MSSITTQPIKNQQTTFNLPSFNHQAGAPVSIIMTAAARAFSGSSNGTSLLLSSLVSSATYLKSPYVIGIAVIGTLGLTIFFSQNRTITRLEQENKDKKQEISNKNLIIEELQKKQTANQTTTSESKIDAQLANGAKDVRIKDLEAQLEQCKAEIKRLQPNSTFEPQSPYGTPGAAVSTPKPKKKTIKRDVETPVKQELAQQTTTAKRLAAAFDSDSDAE